MTIAGRKAGKKKSNGATAPASAELPRRPDPRLLLDWYDRYGRVLPWRVKTGDRPDPYATWLSEIMLQQTTVKAVAPYYARFLARWPTVAALAAAPLDEVLGAWAGLGYYARARNLHACARAVAEMHGGEFPPSEDALRALPGVGRYTAAAIAAIAFGRKATPVDGNIERVVARVFAVDEERPAAKRLIHSLAGTLTPDTRAGDFAQALMDLGATICTPKKPACSLCPWTRACVARLRGNPEDFPARRARSKGRLRRGAAFVVRRADGAVLLRRRAERGLLGGMVEVPGSDWTHDFDDTNALAHAPQLFSRHRKHEIPWRRVPGVVTHVFTHFPLELVVYLAQAPLGVPAPNGMRWAAAEALNREALPNVMRKVLQQAPCALLIVR